MMLKVINTAIVEPRAELAAEAHQIMTCPTSDIENSVSACPDRLDATGDRLAAFHFWQFVPRTAV